MYYSASRGKTETRVLFFSNFYHHLQVRREKNNLFDSNKGQIPLLYLVADRFEADRRPAASWNLAYHLAR